MYKDVVVCLCACSHFLTKLINSLIYFSSDAKECNVK